MSTPLAEQDWLRLDNAAKIYPASYSDSSPQAFRLWMELDEPIRYEALHRALERTIRRCPYYQVYLRRGLFWYYLERHQETPPIEVLDDAPVAPIPIRKQSTHLFRVKARAATIAIDVSHVLTDGFGGLTLLATLVAEYLRKCGHAVPAEGYVLDTAAEPDPEEFEDAYRRNFRRGFPAPESLEPAYHIPGVLRVTRYRAITGRVSVRTVLAAARRHGVSLTEYLAAVYIYAIAKVRDESVGAGRSIIRLEVPVNMRRLYPTKTMRNFSLFVSPEIDRRLGSYSFADTVKRVHHSMRMQVDPRELGAQIARNVAAELNPIIRAVPLALKDRYLSYLHHKFGDNLYSGILSNLGNIELPPPMSERVRRIGFCLGANPVIKKDCAVISYGDELSVAFGSVIESRELERHFFTQLEQEGVPVTVSETP